MNLGRIQGLRKSMTKKGKSCLLRRINLISKYINLPMKLRNWMMVNLSLTISVSSRSRIKNCKKKLKTNIFKETIRIAIRKLIWNYRVKITIILLAQEEWDLGAHTLKVRIMKLPTSLHHWIFTKLKKTMIQSLSSKAHLN